MSVIGFLSLTGDIIVLSKFKRSSGFVTARQRSNKEDADAERNVTDAKDVLAGAVAYVNSVTGPDNAAFHKKGYRDCLAWLTKIDRRSKDAVDAQPVSAAFALFTGFQMEDNWVHVRYLLAALQHELKVEEASTATIAEITKAERLLVSVFAIIRAGADDPLPWFLALEGILRSVWRAIGRQSAGPSVFQTRLFNELIIWCNGTALNAFVVRVPRDLTAGGDILVR